MKLFMETTNGEVIETFFNILHQDTARAFDTAIKKNVGIIVKIPLDSGWLSGKYDAESLFNDIRKRWSRDDIKTRAALIKKLRSMIDQEQDLAQTALSFCLAYDAVATVIPGNATIAQLERNIESTVKPISNELFKKLEDFYQQEVKELRLPW